MPLTRIGADQLVLILVAGALLGACHRTDEPAASRPDPAPTAAAIRPGEPRCVRAGGRCVGPAAIAARPAAPCPHGMQRVDDVKLPEADDDGTPACLGIPMGEEACCMPAP